MTESKKYAYFCKFIIILYSFESFHENPLLSFIYSVLDFIQI